MNRSISGVVRAACGVLVICLFTNTASALADDGDEISKLWNEIIQLQRAGKGRETLPLAQRMLALAERSFANKPAVLGPCIDFVAEAYEDRDELAKAEVIFKRALAMREKALGPDDPAVATSLENLGRVAENQGRLAEAETLVKRALAIHEKNPGRESDEFAGTANVLAGVYKELGRFAEAEPSMVRNNRAKGCGLCRAASSWPGRDASWPATGWSTTKPPPV